jgi:hypothetical protein
MLLPRITDAPAMGNGPMPVGLAEEAKDRAVDPGYF